MANFLQSGRFWQFMSSVSMHPIPTFAVLQALISIPTDGIGLAPMQGLCVYWRLLVGARDCWRLCWRLLDVAGVLHGVNPQRCKQKEWLMSVQMGEGGVMMVVAPGAEHGAKVCTAHWPLPAVLPCALAVARGPSPVAPALCLPTR